MYTTSILVYFSFGSCFCLVSLGLVFVCETGSVYIGYVAQTGLEFLTTILLSLPVSGITHVPQHAQPDVFTYISGF